MNSLDQKKRIIYFSTAGILLIVGAYIAWRYFISGSTSTQPTGQPPINGGVPGFPTTPGNIPTTPGGSTGTSTPPVAIIPPEAQKLLRLTDYSIIGPSLNKDENQVLFYKKEGGGLYGINFDATSTEKLSPITIVGLLDVVWSSSRDRSAVAYLDQDTIKGFLHIGTSSVAVLPPDTRSPVWSPDRKFLAYLITKDGITNLIIADAAGKSPRTVFSAPLQDASITWVTQDKIAFLTAPSGRAEGFLFAYTRRSDSLNQIFGPRFGLTSLWSPDGSKILVSFTSRTGNNPQLALLDATGKELQRFPLVTLPDKCAWSPDNKDLYCAVPRKTSPNITWPDDYLRGELATSDRVVDINITTGDVSPVLDEENLSLSNLFVTKDKATLFFINRPDGTLWRYKLKE